MFFNASMHYASGLHGDIHEVFTFLEEAFSEACSADHPHLVMTVNMSINSPSQKGMPDMLKSWKLKEVVLLSVLAVVFAVRPYRQYLGGLYGPIAYEWIFGIWFIVSIICMYIIRKPGTAVLSETVAAAIEVMIGNAVGPRLILSGLIQIRHAHRLWGIGDDCVTHIL